jgi:hypothetical protein
MTPLRRKLLCTAALPMALGFALVAIGFPAAGPVGVAQAQTANPCSPCGAAPAGATGCGVPRLQQAQANPCAAKNPCGANPCAAAMPKKSAAAANPCAAKAPCGSDATSATTGACNPCAVKNPCAASPCAANPCAVKKPSAASANPCATASPCGANPCAAKAPCGAGADAAAAGACNPCAVKNPCAAANPCAANPCAAKNPCAANPCNPCNPCGAAAVPPPDVTPDELRAVYDCLTDHMRSAYGGGWQDHVNVAVEFNLRPLAVAYSNSELDEAKSFVDWKNFATAPYVSSTHGERFVVNHANRAAEAAYGKYEEIGSMPKGGIIAKPSFTISASGDAQLGPLFLMEKMSKGWHPASSDWRYTMVMEDGTVAGSTHGPNAEAVEFCVACHQPVSETQDSLFFIPEEFRVR